jgi:large subunit ribosomal protein L21
VYAIIEDSGQQFKVSQGDVIRVDLRDLDENAKTIEFSSVLLVADGENVKIGNPAVAGAKVVAEIANPLVKGEKLRIFKYKRRKGYRHRAGHRQKYIEVRISQIVA